LDKTGLAFRGGKEGTKPVAAKDAKDPPEDALGEEAWVRTADGERAIRLRRVTHYLRQGVTLTDVRLTEGEDGLFSIRLRMSDRAGEFQLYKQDVAEPRLYKDLGLAVATIRKDFGYLGTITLSTDRRPETA
jgi:hypothetical protein